MKRQAEFSSQTKNYYRIHSPPKIENSNAAPLGNTLSTFESLVQFQPPAGKVGFVFLLKPLRDPERARRGGSTDDDRGGGDKGLCLTQWRCAGLCGNMAHICGGFMRLAAIQRSRIKLHRLSKRARQHHNSQQYAISLSRSFEWSSRRRANRSAAGLSPVFSSNCLISFSHFAIQTDADSARKELQRTLRAVSQVRPSRI